MHGINSSLFITKFYSIERDLLDSPLTPLLVHDIDSGSVVSEFQIISTVEGVTASVTRSGGMYSVRLTLGGGRKVKQIVAGIGSIIGRRILEVQPIAGVRIKALARFGVTEPIICPFQISSSEDKSVIQFEFKLAFPCEGFLSRGGGAYILAPAVRIELEKGILANSGEIITVMMLEADSRDYRVSVAKASLSVSQRDSSGSLSIQGGSNIAGYLQVTGSGYEWIRVISYRTPPISIEVDNLANPATRDDIQAQNLAEARSPGGTEFNWSPIRPSFKPVVWVFRPDCLPPLHQLGGRRGGFGLLDPNMSSEDLLRLIAPLGISEVAPVGAVYPDFVFGEGRTVGHLVELIMRTSSRFSGDKWVLAQVELG